MTITLRPVEVHDCEAVRQLFAQLSGCLMTPDEVLGRMANVKASPVDWLYVAEREGVVRGVLIFRLRERIERQGRYGEVYAIVSDQAIRRQGVGRAMMAYAETLAHEHDCAGMWLVSGFGRKDEAHRFYTDLGYEATGYRFVKMFDD